MTRATGTARMAIAAALACAACASVEGPPPGPSPFRTAKRIVLVRRAADRKAPRGRDALDALKESLDARGYEARIVEVGPGEDGGLRELDRLEERLASRLWSGDALPGRVERLGPDAGAVVARLGADAIVGHHRLDPWLAPPPPVPAQTWGAAPSPQQPAPARRPAGALSLVAADGSAAWFPWGGAGADQDPRALVNAAEAIDSLLAALAGSPDEG
jgi:hypothetical protein